MSIGILNIIKNEFNKSYNDIFNKLNELLANKNNDLKDINDLSELSLIYCELFNKMNEITDINIILPFLQNFIKFINNYEVSEEIILSIGNYLRCIIISWQIIIKNIDKEHLKQLSNVFYVIIQILTKIIELSLNKIENDNELIGMYYDILLSLNDILYDNLTLINTLWTPIIRHASSV